MSLTEHKDDCPVVRGGVTNILLQPQCELVWKSATVKTLRYRQAWGLTLAGQTWHRNVLVPGTAAHA
jgi:hypothetical protein